MRRTGPWSARHQGSSGEAAVAARRRPAVTRQLPAPGHARGRYAAAGVRVEVFSPAVGGRVDGVIVARVAGEVAHERAPLLFGLIFRHGHHPAIRVETNLARSWSRRCIAGDGEAKFMSASAAPGSVGSRFSHLLSAHSGGPISLISSGYSGQWL